MKTSVSNLRAIGIALTGFTVWVLADTSIKFITEASIPPYEIVGVMGLFGVLVMLMKATPRQQIKALWPKRPMPQLVRALLCLTTNICNTIALKHVSLTLFYILIFMAPMVISVLAVFFLRERLTKAKLAAIIIGFIGVLIAANPSSDSAAGDWIGYVAMVFAVLTFSANAVWLRVMTQTETPDSLTFFNFLVEMIAGFVGMLFYAAPLTLEFLVILFMASALSVLGRICNLTALKHTTAATVSQFHYTQIITGAILGYIIWHEIPTLHMLTGVAIIIGSGLYIAAHARRAENLAAVTPR